MIGEPQLVGEGRRLVDQASAAGFALRLFGGVAIWLRASPETRAAMGRHYQDIDFVAHRKDAGRLRALLEARGYDPERVFNATHGARRLLYHSADGSYHLDVFLDRFEMSHVLDLGAQLEAETPTVPAAELLLAKLQVAQVNHKDLSDTAMLLLDHEPGAEDRPGTINMARVAAICAADWGLYTTATDNLNRLVGTLGELSVSGAARDRLLERVDATRQALDDAPKTVGWRMRARVGRRKRWYEVPEEVIR